MVNEPMPWQLTVTELMDALREHQPNAVVALKGIPDLKGCSDEAKRRLTSLYNLQIQPGQSPRSPVFVLRVREDPSSAMD